MSLLNIVANQDMARHHEDKGLWVGIAAYYYNFRRRAFAL